MLKLICKPDYIVLPGDIVNKKFDSYYDENARNFIYKLLKLAPVLYSLGNHENPEPCEYYDLLSSTGVILLNGGTRAFPNDNLIFGGLVWEGQDNFADTLSMLSNSVYFSILLCHKPEMYEKFVRDTNIDLMIAGHAHGGQIRIFGIPLYASVQGFFPKYIDGLYDNRLLVSNGVANTHKIIPRIGNKPSIIELNLLPIF